MGATVSSLIVIPVYNHAGTLRQVVEGALRHGPVLVVDDGSTDLVPPVLSATAYAGSVPRMHERMGHGESGSDNTGKSGGAAEGVNVFPEGHPLYGLPVYYLRHSVNQGKGKAIMTAAVAATALGMTHIITLDADAQHDPDDIPLFLDALAAHPLALFVGKRDFSVPHVPLSSRFGRWFSNFWLKVHTGRELGDSQSGFRAYPLALLETLRLGEAHYSFETEVLVRAAWAGFSLRDIAIRVYYQPGGDRISHFHPLWDNVRLTILNTRLTVRCIMPIPQKHFVQDEHGKLTALHPLRSLRLLLCRNETPKNLALAGGLGVFIGTLPIFGIHSLTIILVLGALRLNKLAGLTTSQLCMPPLAPALCIEVGYYLRHGTFLTEISWQTLGYEALSRLWEWLLGSLLLAPLFGLVCGVTVYMLARVVQRSLRPQGASS